MSFDETFRLTPKIDEVETFKMIGKAKELRVLGPDGFDGPVAKWAEWRMTSFGETVVPRHVYRDRLRDGTEHRVAWVYHDGFNPNDFSSFCLHHVACDCSLEVDNSDTLEEKMMVVRRCPSLLKVLDRRAWFVNQVYGIDMIREYIHYDPDSRVKAQTSKSREFIREAMLRVLEHDYRHPEAWMANVESGWTLIGIMAGILQVPPNHVVQYAKSLRRSGMVQIEGNSIKLSKVRMAQIDAEKVAIEIDKQASMFIEGLEI